MDKNSIKTAPNLPPEIQEWPKANQHQYLLESLGHNLGSAVRSELLPRQLEVCLMGLQSFENKVSSIKSDELASRYQQILAEDIDNATSFLEDHVLMFFIACQLYVGRVAEAVNWFKSVEGGDLTLDASHNDADEVRHIGEIVVGEMTIAECMWHLGNYAKHKDEWSGLRGKKTLTGLPNLNVCENNGTVAANATWRGIFSVTGRSCDSAEDIKVGLESIESSLRMWADKLEDRIISALDKFYYDDSNYTRRLNETFQKALRFKISP